MSRFAHTRRSAFACLPGIAALFLTLAPTSHVSAQTVPTRLRLGADAGLGFILGDSNGGALQLDGQLGLQANDLLAVYWQSQLFWEGWANGTAKLDSFAFWSNLGMLDFTLGRFFQVGGGMGADFGSFGTCNANSCMQASKATHFATEAKVAFIIPLPGARARWGIPLTAHFHSTWLGSGDHIHAVTFTVGILRY